MHWMRILAAGTLLFLVDVGIGMVQGATGRSPADASIAELALAFVLYTFVLAWVAYRAPARPFLHVLAAFLFFMLLAAVVLASILYEWGAMYHDTYWVVRSAAWLMPLAAMGAGLVLGRWLAARAARAGSDA